tara:strand:+ start:76 stop:723 length:648 start_codon:yes stop_codon:yes gene_type:complete
MNSIEIKKSKNLVDYESAVNFMQNKVQNIQTNNSNELLWFLEHDHIYTQGTSANNNEIIKTNNINIIKTNRGGKTTYHGPGQRIIYFLIDLNKRKKDIRKFITVIENSVITLLAEYKIEAKSFKDRVGIWVIESNKIKFDKERKIGAIGLRVSKWVTYHGLSFNIDTNLKYYDFINSCGLKGYKNTSLSELRVNITKEEFDYKFEKIFNKKITEF